MDKYESCLWIYKAILIQLVVSELLRVDVCEADGPEADLHNDEDGRDALVGEGLKVQEGSTPFIGRPVNALPCFNLILQNLISI